MSIFEVKINITVNISIYYRHLHIHKYSGGENTEIAHSHTHPVALPRTLWFRRKRSFTNTVGKRKVTEILTAYLLLIGDKTQKHQNRVENDAKTQQLDSVSRPTEKLIFVCIVLFTSISLLLFTPTLLFLLVCLFRFLTAVKTCVSLTLLLP